MSGFFFPLPFKKCNKLDDYIYIYFFIVLIILLNNFLYNKDCCWCYLEKYRLYYFVILLVFS